MQRTTPMQKWYQRYSRSIHPCPCPVSHQETPRKYVVKSSPYPHQDEDSGNPWIVSKSKDNCHKNHALHVSRRILKLIKLTPNAPFFDISCTSKPAIRTRVLLSHSICHHVLLLLLLLLLPLLLLLHSSNNLTLLCIFTTPPHQFLNISLRALL